jgi:homoserine dehydrogenase
MQIEAANRSNPLKMPEFPGFQSIHKLEKLPLPFMQIRLGLVGLGTVGQGLIELLGRHQRFFAEQLGFDFRVAAACARSQRSLARVQDPHCFKTTDPLAVAAHPEIDVLVELAGGEDAPKPWIETALRAGKHVVTANKALLAKHGTQLFPLAAEQDRFLLFEAAVGGGIPIVKSLQEGLVGNDIEGLASIINGTCNYILTQMSRKKESFAAALAEAQRLGYAEADPGFDVDGMDSLHKVALLASLCFGRYVDYRKLSVEGIRNITALDIQMAEEMGFEVKLLGVVSQGEAPASGILAAVYPALLERGHQLASVQGVLNGIYLKTSAAGPLLLTGAGAGKLPTASSVVSDLVTLARQLATSHPKPPSMAFFSETHAADLVPIDELKTEFYLRLTTVDRPGVLSKVTGILGEAGISIRALTQKPERDSEIVPVIILTHAVRNANVTKALRQIDALDVVRSPTQVIRFYR